MAYRKFLIWARVVAVVCKAITFFVFVALNFPSEVPPGFVVHLTRFLPTVFLNPFCMMRTTWSLTLTLQYGPSRQCKVLSSSRHVFGRPWLSLQRTFEKELFSWQYIIRNWTSCCDPGYIHFNTIVNFLQPIMSVLLPDEKEVHFALRPSRFFCVFSHFIQYWMG